MQTLLGEMMGLLHKIFSKLAAATEDSKSTEMAAEVPGEQVKDASGAMDRVAQDLNKLDKYFEENPEDEKKLMKKLKDI